MEQQRAPQGGISINKVRYEGGQFLPDADPVENYRNRYSKGSHKSASTIIRAMIYQERTWREIYEVSDAQKKSFEKMAKDGLITFEKTSGFNSFGRTHRRSYMVTITAAGMEVFS